MQSLGRCCQGDMHVFSAQFRHHCYSQAHSDLRPQDEDITLRPRAQLSYLYIGYLSMTVQAMRPGRVRLEQNYTTRKMS